MKQAQSTDLDRFLRRLVTAPAARRSAAVDSAMALLDGAPPDAILHSGAQAAKLLSISRPTLWRLVKSGTLKPVHIRGLTRYRRADLLALAAGGAGSE